MLRSLKSCAEECARRRDCRFFIHGKEGTKLDDCYVEYTVGRKCPEGWEEDAFDFWEIGAEWIGCTEPRATNYDSKATLDDGSCKGTCSSTPRFRPRADADPRR